MPTAKNINRACAVFFLFMLCLLFARRSTFYYAEKFAQLKENIEARYAWVPAEPFLKRLFWDYLKLTNRKYINGVVVMNDGRLVHEQIPHPLLLTERADVVIQLKEYLAGKDTPFLFLRAPDAMRGNAQMPRGFENTVLDDGAHFMDRLRAGGVDTLDLREAMTVENMDFARAFFRGDNHWTAETALWAWGKVGAFLNGQYGFGLAENTWNPAEYQPITYENTFLGSASSLIGDPRLKEDITILVPRFPTDFEVTNSITADDTAGEKKTIAAGDYVEVFTPTVNDAEYDNTAYIDLNAVLFKQGNYLYRCQNNAAQTKKKILLIGDSFVGAFVTFLATATEQVDCLYLGPSNEKLVPLIETEKYDLVMFLVYDRTMLHYSGAPGADTIENDRMYVGQMPQ